MVSTHVINAWYQRVQRFENALLLCATYMWFICHMSFYVIQMSFYVMCRSDAKCHFDKLSKVLTKFRKWKSQFLGRIPCKTGLSMSARSMCDWEILKSSCTMMHLQSFLMRDASWMKDVSLSIVTHRETYAGRECKKIPRELSLKCNGSFGEGKLEGKLEGNWREIRWRWSLCRRTVKGLSECGQWKSYRRRIQGLRKGYRRVVEGFSELNPSVVQA